MSDIITRLEEAAEGSRELDALIWAHFRPEKIKVTGWGKHYADDSGRTQVEFELPPKRTRTVTGGKSGMPHAEPVTTSLDAALALAEQQGLDGWNTLYAAMMNWKAHDPRGPLSQTLPLALCLAILKATRTSHD
jgi:hypothetical protein